jgi:uncharacterized protein YecE (DUF72 family)
MSAKTYIGTSGWSYPKGEGSWKGYFYPAGKTNELEYYSQFFNTVEVNSSFYRPPNPGFAKSWVKRTPGDFLFTVKLWQKFTHPQMYKEATGREAVISQDDVELFKSSIDPLASSGKLGALLAQFPPSFRNDTFGQQILNAVIRTFWQYRLAVELRHRIDEPKFRSSVAGEVPLTSDLAYFRFHGRNRDMWWQGNSETRYKYLYSAEELRDLANLVETAAEQTRLLFAFFNNHWRGYAPRNAIDMKKGMGLPITELPVQTELTDEPERERST